MDTGVIAIVVLVAALIACAALVTYLIYRKLVRLAAGAVLLLATYVAAFYLLSVSAPVPGSAPPVVQRIFPSALALNAFLPCLVLDRGLCAARGAKVTWVAPPAR